MHCLCREHNLHCMHFLEGNNYESSNWTLILHHDFEMQLVISRRPQSNERKLQQHHGV